MKDVIIVGAGIAGLSLAFRLRQQGADVLVVDSLESPGGVIRSNFTDGFLLELGPNSTLSKPPVQRLIEDLQLQSEVRVPPKNAKKRFLLSPRVVRNGRPQLVPAPSGFWSAITSPLLSLRAKFRLLREPWISPATTDDESVADFMSRRLGNETSENIVAAMLGGIWAADTKKLSARSALRPLWEFERKHGSLLRGALFGPKKKAKSKGKTQLISFHRGMVQLTNTLAERLRNDGVELHLSSQVNSMNQCEEAAVVRYHDPHLGHEVEAFAKYLVIALDAPGTAALVQPFSPELSQQIRDIPYAPLGVLHLAYPVEQVKHPLDGFGFLVPPCAGLAVLGAIFNSTLFPERSPEGWHLLTCFVGGARQPELAEVDNPLVLQQAKQELAQLLHIDTEPRILGQQFYLKAIPNYPLGHFRLETQISMFTSHFPRLRIMGNWLRGISVSDRIEQSELLAVELMSVLRLELDPKLLESELQQTRQAGSR